MSNWTKIDVEESEFKEANDAFRELGFGNFGFCVEEIQFTPLSTSYVMSEWRVKDGNVEAHIFQPGRSLYKMWDHAGYAYALFNSIVKEFSMEHYQDRLTVEFIPEVNGWYILIEGVAMLKEPDSERIARAFNTVRP